MTRVARIYFPPPANCATLEGAQESDGLILAAPRVHRAQRPARVAVSPGPGTAAFSHDLCNDRHPHLCEAFRGVCLVEPHPHERVLHLHRDESGELLELFVGVPEVLQASHH